MVKNEDKDMKSLSSCSGGPSTSFARAKTAALQPCLQMLLLVLLQLGLTSCTLTTPAPVRLTANAQTSVHYFLEISVEVTGQKKNQSQIASWLQEVLQNNLESCESPDSESTTASPTYSPAMSTNEAVTTFLNRREKLDPFQGVEVSCSVKTQIRKTNCSLTLALRRPLRPCCILRALCTGCRASADDIRVWAKRANRLAPLQEDCGRRPETLKMCEEDGVSGTSCALEESQCGSERKNRTCSCSAYCRGTDAFYTFRVSARSGLLDLISQLNHTCSSPDASCPFPAIASEYKDGKIHCQSETPNCRVILRFRRDVPVCMLLSAVTSILKPGERIGFGGRVTRAAICGYSDAVDELLDSPFTMISVNQPPDLFCPLVEASPSISNILNCQPRRSVLVYLEERCVLETLTTTTAVVGPKVTTKTPTTNASTSSSVNVTSSRPKTSATTTPRQNATTTRKSGSVATRYTTANVTASLPRRQTWKSINVVGSHVGKAISSKTPETSLEVQASLLLEQTRNVSRLNSSQVNQLVSELERLLSGPNVSLPLGSISINIVSNLLGADPEVLAQAATRIIRVVDTVGLKLVLEKDSETLLSPAVALSVKTADGTNFEEMFFSISSPDDVQVRGDARRGRRPKRDSTVPQGTIKLPHSLTQNLTAEEQQLVTKVQFNFYQNSTVFQDRTLGEHRKLNSGILGASVTNLSITGLQDEIVIHLRNTEPVPANFVAACVYWDFLLYDGKGGWNPDGCSVRNSSDEVTVCGCNHLTSFGILLDLSRQPITSRVQATILTFITYIGCGISAIFLAITLLTYLSFGKLRKDIPAKILIQLCFALLLLNLVFLVDAWLALYPNAVGLCISTAWFLHYFLLVSFSWMGLEAVHMYIALVKVFNSYISRYMLKFSLAGWGIPMIVVIIVIAVDKDNYGLVSYGRFSDGTSDDFCWLKNDVAFYVAVVAYFCVIFLFNCTMLVVVLVQVCRIKRQNPQNVQHRTTLQDVRSMVGITVLLGLTWGFAFFAWGPVNLAFMYLFAIFNSLQGFFIFVFHCAVKENVRRQWRTYLCCGRMRLAENSEWSRTATQKPAKKSTETNGTSLHSQFNHSSSSSSFLVSESSGPAGGIGSPFGDRTITADEDTSRDVILNEINRQDRHQQGS